MNEQVGDAARAIWKVLNPGERWKPTSAEGKDYIAAAEEALQVVSPVAVRSLAKERDDARAGRTEALLRVRELEAQRVEDTELVRQLTERVARLTDDFGALRPRVQVRWLVPRGEGWERLEFGAAAGGTFEIAVVKPDDADVLASYGEPIYVRHVTEWQPADGPRPGVL